MGTWIFLSVWGSSFWGGAAGAGLVLVMVAFLVLAFQVQVWRNEYEDQLEVIQPQPWNVEPDWSEDDEEFDPWADERGERPDGEEEEESPEAMDLVKWEDGAWVRRFSDEVADDCEI